MRAATVTPEQEDRPDDAEIVRRARTTRAAFEPLYWRYHDRVYRYLRTRTPQEADAADLTQQVFLRALDQLHQYDETRGTVAAWLFGIARHSATDFLRRRRRTLGLEDALLDSIYNSASLPSAVDNAVLAALHRGPTSHHRWYHRLHVRRSFAALVPASLLLLGVAIAASLRASSPASVSAQSILRRAAAVQLPANQALHVVYRESYYRRSSPPGPLDMVGRNDIWAEYDARGQITHIANTDVQVTQGITTWIDRCVGGRTTKRCYNYEPASKLLHKPFTVTAAQAAREAGPLRGVDMLNGAGVARLLTGLMHHSSAGIRLLPERRLSGVLVYPIRVRMGGGSSGPQPAIIYYFDAHSYILRGMAVLPPNAPGFADVVSQETVLVKREIVSLGAVPPRTFELRPPTGDQVWVVLP